MQSNTSPVSRRVVATILTSLVIAAIGAPQHAARAAGTTAVVNGPHASAADVLSRIATRDAMLESYAVPVHIDVRLRKLISFRFGLDGMQYFKRPGHLALDVRSVPAKARRLFSQVGAPFTWADRYDMQVIGATGDGTHTTYRLQGVPKQQESDIDHVLLDIDSDPAMPLHGQWFSRDGTTITTTLEDQPAGPYSLPKRIEADVSVSGYKIHAVLEYGDYTVNATVADSVFTDG